MAHCANTALEAFINYVVARYEAAAPGTYTTLYDAFDSLSGASFNISATNMCCPDCGAFYALTFNMSNFTNSDFVRFFSAKYANCCFNYTTTADTTEQAARLDFIRNANMKICCNTYGKCSEDLMSYIQSKFYSWDYDDIFMDGIFEIGTIDGDTQICILVNKFKTSGFSDAYIHDIIKFFYNYAVIITCEGDLITVSNINY